MFGDAFIVVHLDVLVNYKNTEGGIFVDSCKFTPFGLCVKTELLKRGKTQKWLEEEITNRTGLFADSGYMDKILKGKRNAPKVVQAIRDILEIQDCNQDTSSEAQ